MNIVYFYLQMVGKTMILDYSKLSWKMLFADTGRETVVETFHDKIYTDKWIQTMVLMRKTFCSEYRRLYWL